MIAAVLFDLDETLVVDEAAAGGAFAATARHAAERHVLDSDRLALDARRIARELWSAAPTHPYCRRIGISSWEGLWAPFEGNDPETRELRAWAPTYRRESWRRALAAQEVEDDNLATALGERFGVERRARHTTFPEAPAVLAELASQYRLGLVTNGDASLQREKLAASGLAECFDAVVISGEIGIGKPAAEPFREATALLGIGNAAVMVGDNPVNDVEGAIGAGLRAVWLDRGGDDAPDQPPGEVPSIASLGELRDLLATMG